MRQISKTRMYTEVSSEIRKAILVGELRPGSWLREEAISEQLQVSRTPVREAFRQLGAEGLLEVLPGQGARVRTFSEKDIVDSYAIRLCIEPWAAALAVRMLTPASLHEIEQAFAAMERLSGRTDERDPNLIWEAMQTSSAFHLAIARATDNAHLTEWLGKLLRLPVVFSMVWRRPTIYPEAQIKHLDILESIRKRDAEEAARCMREHIQEVFDHLVAHGLGMEGEELGKDARSVRRA